MEASPEVHRTVMDGFGRGARPQEQMPHESPEAGGDTKQRF
jgi:hypothetical protein